MLTTPSCGTSVWYPTDVTDGWWNLDRWGDCVDDNTWHACGAQMLTCALLCLALLRWCMLCRVETATAQQRLHQQEHLLQFGRRQRLRLRQRAVRWIVQGYCSPGSNSQLYQQGAALCCWPSCWWCGGVGSSTPDTKTAAVAGSGLGHEDGVGLCSDGPVWFGKCTGAVPQGKLALGCQHRGTHKQPGGCLHTLLCLCWLCVQQLAQNPSTPAASSWGCSIEPR